MSAISTISSTGHFVIRVFLGTLNRAFRFPRHIEENAWNRIAASIQLVAGVIINQVGPALIPGNALQNPRHILTQIVLSTSIFMCLKGGMILCAPDLIYPVPNQHTRDTVGLLITLAGAVAVAVMGPNASPLLSTIWACIPPAVGAVAAFHLENDELYRERDRQRNELLIPQHEHHQ